MTIQVATTQIEAATDSRRDEVRSREWLTPSPWANESLMFDFGN
jgi:hypothetical protein